jgi:hypothetical protein
VVLIPVPVTCGNCGQVFFLQNFTALPGTTFVNCYVRAACAHCGDEGGGVLHGVVGLAQDIIGLIVDGTLTEDATARFRDVLSEAKEQNATPDQVAQLVEQRVPEARSVIRQLVDLMNANPGPIGVVGILVMILIAVLQQQWPDKRAPAPNAAPAVHEPTATMPAVPHRRAAAKVGRNHPCPCGSKRKAKHCHPEHCI